MELIRITADNLEKEHICCAIASAKDPQVAAKKAWLAARLADGLVFLKGNVRGKCFIEYLPAERAWAPVEAPGAMMIDCFWVSGQLQGHGNATLLLNACIDDCRAKGKTGLAVLSSPKKRPFLSDPGYLRRRGFAAADRAEMCIRDRDAAEEKLSAARLLLDLPAPACAEQEAADRERAQNAESL